MIKNNDELFTAECGVLYTGEYDRSGNPHGRGTIILSGGVRYSGEIDYAEQRGRGIFRYPDGSRLECGFTIVREMPAWRFTDAEGSVISGFVSRFPADDREIEAGRFNDADTVCGHITRAAAALGLTVEYNARTILADALLRRGVDPEDARCINEAVSGAAGCVLSETPASRTAEGGDILAAPQVIRYIYT